MVNEVVFRETARNLRASSSLENLSLLRKLFISYFNSEGTREEYERCLGGYLGYLRMHFGISEIRATSDHINAFKNFLYVDVKNSEVTINKKLSIVSSYYTFLMRRKIVLDNPVRFIKKFKVSSMGRSRAITRNEIELIYSSLKENTAYQITIKTLIIVLFELGIRVSELINLTTENIIYDYGDYCLDFTQKGGKNHKVKLNELTKCYLGKLLQLRSVEEGSVELLFRTKTGQRFDRKNIYRLLAGIGKRNDLKVKIHPHTARVSFIREALESGREIYSIKRSVGHSSVKTTERYLA